MKAIHLFLLAAMIGIELVLGIIVAPVIFYPQNLIGENVLSLFQSGLMMTEIFVKFGYLLLFVSVFSFVYMFYAYFTCEAKFQLKFSTLMLSILILILALLFVFYFSAYIVETQALGENATQSMEFQKMHGASEIVMKLMVIMQMFLYFLSFKIAKKV